MADPATPTWHRVAQFHDVTAGDPRAVRIDDRQIALFRIGAEIYATDNICTHEHALLSDGFVDDAVVECPLHQARFHIPTGRVLSPPAVDGLKTYPVRLDGNEIWILV